MDQSTPPYFYVVTNNKLFGVWEAREGELPELLRTHPGYDVVQSYPSRREAEARIEKLRDGKA